MLWDILLTCVRKLRPRRIFWAPNGLPTTTRNFFKLGQSSKTLFFCLFLRVCLGCILLEDSSLRRKKEGEYVSQNKNGMECRMIFLWRAFKKGDLGASFKYPMTFVRPLEFLLSYREVQKSFLSRCWSEDDWADLLLKILHSVQKKQDDHVFSNKKWMGCRVTLFWRAFERRDLGASFKPLQYSYDC